MNTNCTPGHPSGNKPQIVPIAGNQDRPIPAFVVYHGGDYLNAAGKITHHPVQMSYEFASQAVEAHEAASDPNVCAYPGCRDNHTPRR